MPKTKTKQPKWAEATKWEELAKTALGKALLKAHQEAEQHRFEGQLKVARIVGRWIKGGLPRPLVKLAVWKILRIKQQSADPRLAWADAYMQLPNAKIWRAVGMTGVLTLLAAPEGIRAKAIKQIVDTSKLNEEGYDSPVVSQCYVETTLTNLGAPVAAQSQKCGTLRSKSKSSKGAETTTPEGKQTKTAAAPDAEALRDLARDLRGVIARAPHLAGEFDKKTLDTLKQLA